MGLMANIEKTERELASGKIKKPLMHDMQRSVRSILLEANVQNESISNIPPTTTTPPSKPSDTVTSSKKTTKSCRRRRSSTFSPKTLQLNDSESLELPQEINFDDMQDIALLPPPPPPSSRPSLTIEQPSHHHHRQQRQLEHQDSIMLDLDVNSNNLVAEKPKTMRSFADNSWMDTIVEHITPPSFPNQHATITRTPSTIILEDLIEDNCNDENTDYLTKQNTMVNAGLKTPSGIPRTFFVPDVPQISPKTFNRHHSSKPFSRINSSERLLSEVLDEPMIDPNFCLEDPPLKRMYKRPHLSENENENNNQQTHEMSKYVSSTSGLDSLNWILDHDQLDQSNVNTSYPAVPPEHPAYSDNNTFLKKLSSSMSQQPMRREKSLRSRKTSSISLSTDLDEFLALASVANFLPPNTTV